MEAANLLSFLKFGNANKLDICVVSPMYVAIVPYEFGARNIQFGGN